MKDIVEKSQEASTFLKLLANPNRLAILCCLHEQRYNVTELTVKLNMPQAAMSNQLALLRKAGLVASEVKHRERVYYIKDPKVAEMINVLHRFFCEVPSEKV